MNNSNARVPLLGIQNRKKNENAISSAKSNYKFSENPCKIQI